jgi:hypothetical protein
MPTKTKSPASDLETADLRVQQAGEEFNNSKSALKILKQSLKPVKAPKAERGPSARGAIIAALIIHPDTDLTELVSTLGCGPGTVNESRMVAKAVADIREGFAPTISSSRLVGEALRYSGATALPSKLRPSEPKDIVAAKPAAKAIEAAKPTAEPSKKTKQIAAGGTIRKGALQDALDALAANHDLNVDGLMVEANVSRSIAARAIREHEAV